jgi:2-aminobenzoate-CoA ligase
MSAHVDTFAADNLPPKPLWPELLLGGPDFTYPDQLNCVSALLDRWVDEGHGERPCLFSAEEQLTYAELQARVNRIANVLVKRFGLVPGNRVLLRSANTITMVACYLAVMKAGGIVVATMPLLRGPEIAYPLNKAQISIALCDRRLADDMEQARRMAPCLRHVCYWGTGGASLEALMADASPVFDAVQTSCDDVCLIAFTSGTTGEPKGTMHFHRDMLAICDGYAKHIVQGRADDRFIGTAPLAFTFGLAIVVFPMRIGASGILVERAGAEELANAIARFKATICFTAPTAYRQLLRLSRDLGSLRRCISAGEALSKATFEAWHSATGVKLIDGIGGTEMLHIFISAPEGAIKPGATGRPVPGFQAKIFDDHGNEVAPNTVGRLGVRGPIGCRYLADPRQTKYVQNGWNFTGDSFLMDEDGYFWYQARNDGMIISSGYNIAGPEVEDVLMRHPAVHECAVIGIPNEARGNIVKAFVVLDAAAAAGPELVAALQDFVKAQIAPFKYPREIEFVASLPKTPSGKIRHFALKSPPPEASVSRA